MYLNSSDLEMVYGKGGSYDQHNGLEQVIGIRFRNVTIDPSASISNAYIQFAAADTSSAPCSLTIKGAAIDDAPGFTTSTGNVSNRAKTTASVNWSPLTWNAGSSGPDQRTTDISTIVAEIINRSGWSSGNSMVFIITSNSTGTGTRSAVSYKGSSTAAPLLHVEFD